MAFNQNSVGGGTTARLTFGHNAFVDGLGTLSLFIWAFPNALAKNVVNDNTLLMKRTQDNANSGLFAWLYTNDGVSTSNNVEFDAYNWTTTQGTWIWDGPQDTNTHSHLLTYSYSSTANAPTYYLDGVAQTVQLVGNAPAGSIGSDTAPLYVGGGIDGAGTGFNRSFGGSLSHAAIWNAVLTPLEARLLAGGAPPLLIRPDALVFYCPCSPDPAQALDLGRAQLGVASITGTWLPADDPFGLLLPARGEAPVAFSPAFQALPYRRPNLPLYRR